MDDIHPTTPAFLTHGTPPMHKGQARFHKIYNEMVLRASPNSEENRGNREKRRRAATKRVEICLFVAPLRHLENSFRFLG